MVGSGFGEIDLLGVGRSGGVLAIDLQGIVRLTDAVGRTDPAHAEAIEAEKLGDDLGPRLVGGVVVANPVVIGLIRGGVAGIEELCSLEWPAVLKQRIENAEIGVVDE